jgi:hypothetical protein
VRRTRFASATLVATRLTPWNGPSKGPRRRTDGTSCGVPSRWAAGRAKERAVWPMPGVAGLW